MGESAVVKREGQSVSPIPQRLQCLGVQGPWKGESLSEFYRTLPKPLMWFYYILLSSVVVFTWCVGCQWSWFWKMSHKWGTVQWVFGFQHAALLFTPLNSCRWCSGACSRTWFQGFIKSWWIIAFGVRGKSIWRVSPTFCSSLCPYRGGRCHPTSHPHAVCAVP